MDDYNFMNSAETHKPIVWSSWNWYRTKERDHHGTASGTWSSCSDFRATLIGTGHIRRERQEQQQFDGTDIHRGGVALPAWNDPASRLKPFQTTRCNILLLLFIVHFITFIEIITRCKSVNLISSRDASLRQQYIQDRISESVQPARIPQSLIVRSLSQRDTK